MKIFDLRWLTTFFFKIQLHMVELSAKRQGFGFNSVGENSATPSTVHVSLRRNEKKTVASILKSLH